MLDVTATVQDWRLAIEPLRFIFYQTRTLTEDGLLAKNDALFAMRRIWQAEGLFRPVSWEDRSNRERLPLTVTFRTETQADLARKALVDALNGS